MPLNDLLSTVADPASSHLSQWRSEEWVSGGGGSSRASLRMGGKNGVDNGKTG